MSGSFTRRGGSLLVVPGSVPADAPAAYRWKLSAIGETVESFQARQDPIPEEVDLHLTLWLPLPGGVDTATVTVAAEVRDDSGPIVVGVPLPLVAVDSARRTLSFAEVGERPDIDTLRLSPSSVEAR